MNLHLFFLFVQSFSATLLILLACVAIRIRHTQFSRYLFLLLCICSLSYHLRTRYEYEFWIPEVFHFELGLLSIPTKILMNAFNGVFMLFVHTLLREGKMPQQWLMLLFAFQIGLEAAIQLVHPQILTGDSPLLIYAMAQLSGAMQVFFTAMVIYWVLVDWRADLVETRRWIRLVVLLYRGFWSVGLVLMYRVLIPQEQFIAFQAHVVVVTINALFLLILAIVLLRIDVELIVSDSTTRKTGDESKTAVGSDVELNQDWARFEKAFNDELVYRDPELNVASLAEQLKIPQYRLRKLIIQKLGYRNFNALLHDYRLKAASQDLRDPDKNHLPILTIALDVGYRSINPFNAAFKQYHGQTPSDYRKHLQLKTSENPINPS